MLQPASSDLINTEEIRFRPGHGYLHTGISTCLLSSSGVTTVVRVTVVFGALGLVDDAGTFAQREFTAEEVALPVSKEQWIVPSPTWFVREKSGDRAIESTDRGTCHSAAS